MNNCNLRVNNTTVLLIGNNSNGQQKANAQLLTGSRLLVSLYISAIDPGATINLNINNSFSADVPFSLIENINTNAIGQLNKILTDVHSIFEFDITVVGGNASYFLGVSVFDNAVASQVDARIENAELNVDLNHILQANGRYDSTRIGNGIYELGINSNGSININTATGSPPVTYVYKRMLDGVDQDMDVNGSAVIKEYSFAPGVGESFFIEGISLLLMDIGAMKRKKFGSISGPLANGLKLSAKTNGSIESEIFNLLDNTDLATHFMINNNEQDDAFLDSRDQMRGSITFKNPILLDGTKGDFIKWQVRDNLSKIDSLRSTIKLFKNV